MLGRSSFRDAAHRKDLAAHTGGGPSKELVMRDHEGSSKSFRRGGAWDSALCHKPTETIHHQTKSRKILTGTGGGWWDLGPRDSLVPIAFGQVTWKNPHRIRKWPAI